MNFLAHLFLSKRTPAWLVGSIMPDIVRGGAPRRTSGEVRRGVQRHWRIDAFTDTHPTAGRSRHRLRKHHGRFAGLLVDILYDHFLATDFERYSPQSLDDFTDEVYGMLAGHGELVPPAMREAVGLMIEHDWLRAYGTMGGVDTALHSMSRRLTTRFKRPVDLTTAMEDLAEQDADLRADFHAFFPELIAHVRADDE